MRHRLVEFAIICVVMLPGWVSCLASELTFGESDTSEMQSQHEWTEWRGGPQQGNSAIAAPVEWSETKNIRWTRAIPGRGNSSPVIKGDLVVVTTSYMAQRASRFRETIATSLLVLSGFTLYFGSLVISQKAMNLSSHRHHRQFVGFASMLCLFLLLVIFGPAILDFDRCPIRSWLGSSVILTMALLLALSCSPADSVSRLLLGVSAFVLAEFVIQGLPSKDHAFRSGWFASSTGVVGAVALFPLSTGVISLVQTLVRRFVQSRRTLKIIGTCIAVLLMIGNFILGARIVSGKIDPPPPEGNPEGILLMPTLAWSLLTSVWILHMISLCKTASSRKNTIGSLGQSRGIALAATGLMGTVSVTALGIYFLTTQGCYLPYHVMVRRIEPLLGWQSCMTMCCCVSGILFIKRQIGSGWRSARAPLLFRVCVLSLGSLSFIAESSTKTEQELTRAVVAVDRQTGELRWVCEALHKQEGELHRYNSAASPTPVIANNCIFAHFGSGGAMCCDLKGRLLWTNEEIIFRSVYGAGASPTVADGVVVISVGTPADAYVCGLDCSHGTVLWRHSINGKAVSGKIVSGNSRTPIIERLNGKTTVLIWEFEGLTGLDVKTGNELFCYKIGNGGGDQVSTLVRQRGFLYCVGGTQVISLRMDELGKSSELPIVWTRDVRATNCATPVIANGMAFCVADTGVASCLDLQTGATKWRQRLAGSFYASPVVCGNRVYFMNLDGEMSVVEADAQFNLVAENRLPGQFLASPVPVNGEIYIRSNDRLYCVHDINCRPQFGGGNVVSLRSAP